MSSGIWDCIRLFTEKLPKGTVKNFGLAAFRNWIDLLTRPKQRQSWEKEFPTGRKMFAGLTSVFDRGEMVGMRGDADRAIYADFLDEAAVILGKPALKEPATLFRNSAAVPEIRQLNERLKTLRTEEASDFPLDAAGVLALRNQIADQVQKIHDIEQDSITRLRMAMSE